MSALSDLKAITAELDEIAAELGIRWTHGELWAAPSWAFPRHDGRKATVDRNPRDEEEG